MNETEQFFGYVDEAEKIVFFGGAGVSTDSGVPDFRSKDGLYNQKDVRFEEYEPEYLLSHDCLVSHPNVFYEYYRQKFDARSVKPNITHYCLAKLEAMGKLKSIVTQNIDGLHQKAGSRRVWEIHGTTLKNYCNACGRKYAEGHIFDCGEDIPRCECNRRGNYIRPEVTLYGEGLPEEAVDGALSDIMSADLLIVAGTSLTVYPASSYVQYFRGKHLVVINRDRINIKLKATDMFIQRPMGEIFEALSRHLDEK